MFLQTDMSTSDGCRCLQALAGLFWGGGTGIEQKWAFDGVLGRAGLHSCSRANLLTGNALLSFSRLLVFKTCDTPLVAIDLQPSFFKLRCKQLFAAAVDGITLAAATCHYSKCYSNTPYLQPFPQPRQVGPASFMGI